MIYWFMQSTNIFGIKFRFANVVAWNWGSYCPRFVIFSVVSSFIQKNCVSVSKQKKIIKTTIKLTLDTGLMTPTLILFTIFGRLVKIA